MSRRGAGDDSTFPFSVPIVRELSALGFPTPVTFFAGGNGSGKSEPEAPLSPQSQLALMVMIHDMLAEDAQFIIATHSPILLAFPGSTIYSFDEVSVAQVPYDELEHVTLTRNFLNAPDLYLRALRDSV